MLAGFFFVITVLIIGAFSWQAAPESWKQKVEAWVTKTMPIVARLASKGWQGIKAAVRYIRRPETRIYTLPVLAFLLLVWLGAEIHPYNTGSVLEALYHPQSLVGIVAFVIWRSAKGKTLKKSYIRNVAGVALLWTCLWYLLYFLRLDPPSFYNDIYDGLLTIATIPLLFGVLVALVARRNTKDPDTKRIVFRTILIAAVTWTALGPLGNYVKYGYVPSVTESELQEMRRYTTPTNRTLLELECERRRDVEERAYPPGTELSKVRNRLFCSFLEFQVDPWLRRDRHVLDLVYSREDDSLYDMTGTW